MQHKKICIFGRPGSGKSTFAYALAQQTGLPLYHLDKYFFTQGWAERPMHEFLALQQGLVDQNAWIIDGNCIKSLEVRFARADVAFYFHYSAGLCIWRIFKRRFTKTRCIDDRAVQCPEVVRWRLLTYMWGFDKRVRATLEALKQKYPHVLVVEIKSPRQLKRWMERHPPSKA
jgi:adenylate kinase family enzyme